MVKIEVVYKALNQDLFYRELELALGSTVADALELAEIYTLHPETQTMPVGIYSKIVNKNHILRMGDRIEIYRPLLIDPKEKRRRLSKTILKNKLF